MSQPPYYNQYQAHAYASQTTSPPPLQHPTPTHPPAPILAQSPPPPNLQQPPLPPQPSSSQHYPPQQQFYQHSYAHQQQQQQQPHPPQGYMDPNAPMHFNIPGLDISGSAATQLGMQFGKSAFEAGQQYMQQNVGKYVPIGSIRYYWQVNNAYVKNKLLLLLFPYRHKSWTRLPQRSNATGQPDGYKVPKEDMSAPDLYIPTMAFMTYILLVGIPKDKAEKFNPEILGLTASKGLGLIAFEVVLIRLACYLTNIAADVPLLDLVAYSGYIFVSLIVTMLVRFLDTAYVPWWLHWLVFAYMSTSLGFFLLRSLRYTIFPDASASSSTMLPTQRRRRVHFLFAVAALQWLLMYVLLS